MNEATQNLIKDAEQLIHQFNRIERINDIGQDMTVDEAKQFDYEFDADERFVYDSIWDNEASALGENKVGSYPGLNLIELGSVEAVLKAIDPDTYDALQAVEDFIAVGAILF